MRYSKRETNFLSKWENTQTNKQGQELIGSCMSFLFGGQPSTDKLILQFVYIFIFPFPIWVGFNLLPMPIWAGINFNSSQNRKWNYQHVSWYVSYLPIIFISWQLTFVSWQLTFVSVGRICVFVCFLFLIWDISLFEYKEYSRIFYIFK